MKLILTTLFIFIAILSSAQNEEKKVIRVNPLHENMELLENRTFRYPSFQAGKVIFKDSVVVEANLNYHQIADEIHFISPKGDTLSLSKPEIIYCIAIGMDTFYFYDKGYISQLTKYPSNNLFTKRYLKFIGKEKKGAYGTYGSTTSVNSVSDLNLNEPEMTRFYKADENSVYVYNIQYLISDKFNNFFPATKKTVFNIFSKNEKELKQYFSSHHVNFSKKEEIEKLLEFIHSL